MSSSTVIYKATSKTSGKSYIGKTTYGLHERKSQHLRSARNNVKNGMILHNAIRKYGETDFEWEIVFTSVNLIILGLAEAECIYYYDTLNNGYNTKPVEGLAEITNQYSDWQLLRKDILKRNKLRKELGVQQLPETRDKISIKNTGKKRTLEQNKNMSRVKLKNIYRVFSPSGGVYVTNHLIAFCRYFNLEPSGLYRVAQGTYKQIKGWRVEIV